MSTLISKKNNILIIVLLLFLLFTNVTLLISLSFEIIVLERFCSYTILICSFLIYFISFFIKKRFDKSDYFSLLLLLYLVFLSALKGWGRQSIIAALIFFSMITAWRSSSIVLRDDAIRKIIGITFFSQGILLIGLFFSPVAYKSYLDNVLISEELTLGFSNPNQTGIIIFSTLAIMLFTLLERKTSKIFKLLIFLEIIFLSFLLLLTKARTSIIGYIFFLLIALFKKKLKINKFLSGIIICIPLLFVYIYMWLASTDLENIDFFGKKIFSGREELYRQVIKMNTDIYFGNLSYFNFQNSHNVLLTILVNIGICGLIIYILFVIITFNKFYAHVLVKEQMLSGIAILSLFIMGCTEAAHLISGTIYYVHLFLILIFSNIPQDALNSCEEEVKT